MPPQNLPITPNNPTAQQPKASAWLGIFMCAVCALFIAGLFFFTIKDKNNGVSAEVAPEVATTTTEALAPFTGLHLEAKAAYVIDVRDQRVLFEKNGELPLPIASVTKILTALVATQTLSPDTSVTITPTSLQTEGESGLLAYEVWDLPDLISFMLVTSSNDAATALKNAYEGETGGSFIAAMNSESLRLGLSHSSFRNETGLDIGSEPSNTGSAEDMAILLAAALRTIPEALDATRSDSFTFTSRTGNLHQVKNTNMLANAIPWSVGAKTGFTDTAGGNLAVSFDASIGRPVVLVVLGSSREGRFADMQKLVEATLASIPLL